MGLGLLITEAILLAGTIPVLGFLALWGSAWEGSPEQLAQRRSAVRWVIAAGLGNAVAFVLVLAAASQVNQARALPATALAAAWVTGLGIAWGVAAGSSMWPVSLILTVPVLLALLVLRRAPAPAVP